MWWGGSGGGDGGGGGGSDYFLVSPSILPLVHIITLKLFTLMYQRSR